MRPMIISKGTRDAITVCELNLKVLARDLILARGKRDIAKINADIERWVMLLCMTFSAGAKYALAKKKQN